LSAGTSAEPMSPRLPATASFMFLPPSRSAHCAA
jgi:hypothetical protein